LRVVETTPGAGSAPRQPFGRATGKSAGTALRPRLLPLRTALQRRLPVFRLRAQLLCDHLRLAGGAGAFAIALFDRIGSAIETVSWHTGKAAIRAIQWRRVALAASAPFVLPSEFRAAMVRILAYLSAIGAMSLIAAELVKQPQTAAMMEAPARPAWVNVEKPWPAFQLSMPGFSESDAQYTIRRHAEGGGRKDILSFGELGRTQRFLSFDIYRAGSEIGSFGRAVDDVRELAAEHGRVSGLRGAMPIESKFGKLQTFEFAIGPFSGYNCIGFVRTFDGPRVQIGGLSCNMKLLVDQSAISCALDRLTLMSAGSDPDIARLFARAELKRNFCGLRDHLLYATPKRPGDVTHLAESKPRLRGRIAR
jgi:hypothetical protein